MRGQRAAASVPVASLLWCCAGLAPPGASGTRPGAPAGLLRRTAADLRGGIALVEESGSGPNFPDPQDYELPTCDCTCCTVLERRLDEVHESTGALLKCALDEGGPGRPVVKRVPSGRAGEMAASDFLCPGAAGGSGVAAELESRRCSPDSGNPVQASAAVLARPGPAGTDYNRFCLFQCRPRDFSVGEPCLPIDPAAANESMTAHGNGRDPGLQPMTAGAAPLLVPELSLHVDAAAVASGQPDPAALPPAGAVVLEEPPRTLMAILEQRLSELLDQEIQQFPWLPGSC